ncbi:216_t:CDS:2, partial [Paraglomus brasilianum]
MDKEASSESKVREFKNYDGSSKLNIQKLRETVSETKKKEIKGIIARHEALFKELFYTIESEKNGEPDWNQIDKKLHSYLQERRLQYKSAESATQKEVLKPYELRISTSLTSSAANMSSTRPEAGPSSASTEPSTPTEPSPTTKRPKRIPPPPIERMVTRAASGAIAPKSVDEILKDAERNAHPYSPISATSPQSAKFPLKLSVNTHQRKDSKRITSGRSPDSARTPTTHMIPRQSEQSRPFDREAILAHYQDAPLHAVLQEFNKVIFTSDWQLAQEEVRMVKVLKEIEERKVNQTLSTRQRERFRDPTRLPILWDVLLYQMNLMAIDFYEERKLKKLWAYQLAYACAEWHNSSEEKKRTLCVRRLTSQKAVSIQPDIIIKLEEDTGPIEGDQTDGTKRNNGTTSVMRDEVMVDVCSVEEDQESSIFGKKSTKTTDSATSRQLSPNDCERLRERISAMSFNQSVFPLPEGVESAEELFPELPVLGASGLPNGYYMDPCDYGPLVPLSP